MKQTYHTKLTSKGSTDGAVVHVNKDGIPTAVISIPSKYIHSTVEIVDLNDLDNTLNLVINSIKIAKIFYKFYFPLRKDRQKL